MDSFLDSLVWIERLSPRRKARRSRKTWLRRLVVMALVLVALGLLWRGLS